MSQTKKFVILAVVLVATVALDQITKVWADNSLANGERPLSVQIQAADDGKTLGAVLSSRFPELSGEALDVAVRERTTLLDQGATLTPDTPVFAPDAQHSIGYYAFARGDLDVPPRRVIRNEAALLDRWLAVARPDVPTDARRAAIREKLADVTLAPYLAERIPYLDEDEAGAVASGRTFPIPRQPPQLRPDRVVHAGETYLLTERHITVIPGFFNLIYAENPGAAWGFMAQASEHFRRIFFTLVSATAVVFILVILIRLEPSQKLATVAFAAILGGALGNFIDRLRFGYVIDFIDNYYQRFHWPTYNVADIAITLGVGALLYELLLRKNSTLFKGIEKVPAPEKAARGKA